MKIKVFTILCIVSLLYSYADDHIDKQNAYIHVRYPSGQKGFFATLNHVLRHLYFYDHQPESGQYKGLMVDFGTKGMYYDPKLGPNWWNYYFEPLEIGICSGSPKSLTNSETEKKLLEIRLDRQSSNSLILKYIHVKPEVLDAVLETEEQWPEGATLIGIHYRGTDKNIKEAPRIHYETVLEAIVAASLELQPPIHLFVATDEADFLAYIQHQFPGHVTSQMGAKRSVNGECVHKKSDEPYKRGFEALVDCLVLSQCDLLIRTQSNLSGWSGRFNPDIPMHLLLDDSKKGS